MSFAEKLKAARERLGLTQAEAAARLGVSFESVSKWERALSTPAAITQEGALSRLYVRGALSLKAAQKKRAKTQCALRRSDDES